MSELRISESRNSNHSELKRTRVTLGVERRKLTYGIIIGTFIAVVLTLLSAAFPVGALKIRPIKIFEFWMSLIPLFFVYGIAREFVEGWAMSRSLGSLATVLHLVVYGAAELFAISLAVLFFWDMLLGKRVNGFWLRLPGLCGALLAGLFTVCGFMLLVRLLIEALLLMVRLFRQGKYLVAILIGAVSIFGACCLALIVLV